MDIEKVKIITDINLSLISGGQEQLKTDDFDVLIDMPIEDLLHAQKEIKRQLRYLKKAKRESV